MESQWDLMDWNTSLCFIGRINQMEMKPINNKKIQITINCVSSLLQARQLQESNWINKDFERHRSIQVNNKAEANLGFN